MYKNISTDVVTKLGKFVFLYESEKLCSNKDKETKSLIPRIVDAFNLMINPHFSLRDTIAQKGKLQTDKLYATPRVRSASFLNSFLYHLRNAFSHGQIEVKNDNYFITDYGIKENEKGEKKKVLTAKGSIPSAKLEEFLDILINDYETDNSTIPNINQTNSNNNENKNS